MADEESLKPAWVAGSVSGQAQSSAARLDGAAEFDGLPVGAAAGTEHGTKAKRK